jgi:hypothetical protein
MTHTEGQGHGFDANGVVDLDKDAGVQALGGAAVADTLRRVVAHLDRHAK